MGDRRTIVCALSFSNVRTESASSVVTRRCTDEGRVCRHASYSGVVAARTWATSTGTITADLSLVAMLTCLALFRWPRRHGSRREDANRRRRRRQTESPSRAQERHEISAGWKPEWRRPQGQRGERENDWLSKQPTITLSMLRLTRTVCRSIRWRCRSSAERTPSLGVCGGQSAELRSFNVMRVAKVHRSRQTSCSSSKTFEPQNISNSSIPVFSDHKDITMDTTRQTPAFGLKSEVALVTGAGSRLPGEHTMIKN